MLLRGNREGSNGSVLFPHIHFRLFHLFHFGAHLLRHEPHLPALLREEVRLVLIFLNLLFKLRIFSILSVNARRDVAKDISIIPGVLLYLPRKDIEIKHSRGECVEEFRIVRDDDAGLRILNEKLREVFDARGVKVVCRLVQEKQVWVLDER